MANRRMTFTIPAGLATQFLKTVAAHDRSRFVAEAIAAKLRERKQRLVRSCEMANADSGVLAIEKDWDALADRLDGIVEPWTDIQSIE